MMVFCDRALPVTCTDLELGDCLSEAVNVALHVLTLLVECWVSDT